MSVKRRWRKSSFSAEDANCVAVAHGGEEVLVRDSKQPSGPTLAFTPDHWTHLLNHLAD
ncbi:DUF397 domain-containing protein [Actinophytocola xanthii]|uniref:DUF397 domain-containing protein n=1 Tax=Actinophytocola xanthii TaxID=1912961 RepID=A0A1Q8CQY5_9PSEU|nr:DUF397 domain-containing protein [Actinophytocola xanthii]OLF16752.1 hypothetical protein BU204_14890 [Actinophytocola xanthii]